jgi:anthranilate synthase/aminodeoxychorismate synthase-like glutamine amidotransferase
MIVLIDNYDSFTYNLYQYLCELGAQVKVFRNDKITINKLKKINPSRLVISPGPGRPENAGLSCQIIREFSGKIPILGVCLGHQAIGFVFGATIIRAKSIMHGKVSNIYHDNKGVFKKLSNPFEATRYHSLAIDKKSLPGCFTITAKTKNGEIMGIRHNKYALEGVQFHPESIATKNGKSLLANFLAL